jgi:flagellar biosynthesis chaperone FliJ
MAGKVFEIAFNLAAKLGNSFSSSFSGASQKLSDLQTKVAEIEKQLETITAGQDRLRKNIEAGGRDSSLGRQAMEKLLGQENAIEQLEKDLLAARAAAEQQTDDLANYVKNLNVE